MVDRGAGRNTQRKNNCRAQSRVWGLNKMENNEINYSNKKDYITKLVAPLITSAYVFVLVNTSWFEKGYGFLEKLSQSS